MINLVSQFKNILGDDSVYRFINDMAEESKNCVETVEKEFKKNQIKIMKTLRKLFNVVFVVRPMLMVLSK